MLSFPLQAHHATRKLDPEKARKAPSEEGALSYWGEWLNLPRQEERRGQRNTVFNPRIGVKTI